MNISVLTKVFGIFGYPVRHTCSPVMHNAAFKRLGFDAVYLPFEVRPDMLKNAVESLRAVHIAGVNVTIPHKETVMRYLDRIHPLARRIGSVNTIKNSGGKLIGYNTDGPGFIRDIISLGCHPRGKTAVVVGAGGAGKAVVTSLSWAGAKRIFVIDRYEALAQKLARRVSHASFVPFKKWQKKLGDADILVNATPVGMDSTTDRIVSPALLRKGLFVYDLVYSRKTALIRDARKRGLKASDGSGMLLQQGAIAFEIWTGKKAPINVMKKALRSSCNKKRK